MEYSVVKWKLLNFYTLPNFSRIIPNEKSNFKKSRIPNENSTCAERSLHDASIQCMQSATIQLQLKVLNLMPKGHKQLRKSYLNFQLIIIKIRKSLVSKVGNSMVFLGS